MMGFVPVAKFQYEHLVVIRPAHIIFLIDKQYQKFFLKSYLLFKRVSYSNFEITRE